MNLLLLRLVTYMFFPAFHIRYAQPKPHQKLPRYGVHIAWILFCRSFSPEARCTEYSYKVDGDVALPGPGVFVHDILSHTIGVLVLDQDDREVCSEILAKDTPIPSIQTKLFKLCEPSQTAVTIQILESEDGRDAKDCLPLGHFDLNDLPCRPDLIGRIEVTFSLDSNGLLTAKARDIASGKSAELEVDYEVKNNSEVSQAAA